jgi:hypothetical protein
MFPQALSANARAAVKTELSGNEADSSKRRKKVCSEKTSLICVMFMHSINKISFTE